MCIISTFLRGHYQAHQNENQDSLFLQASTVHCLKATKQTRKDSKFLITKSSGILGAHLIDLKRDEYG